MLNTLLSCKILIIGTILISLSFLNHYFKFGLAFSFQEQVFVCLVYNRVSSLCLRGYLLMSFWILLCSHCSQLLTQKTFRRVQGGQRKEMFKQRMFAFLCHIGSLKTTQLRKAQCLDIILITVQQNSLVLDINLHILP